VLWQPPERTGARSESAAECDAVDKVITAGECHGGGWWTRGKDALNDLNSPIDAPCAMAECRGGCR